MTQYSSFTRSQYQDEDELSIPVLPKRAGDMDSTLLRHVGTKVFHTWVAEHANSVVMQVHAENGMCTDLVSRSMTHLSCMAVLNRLCTLLLIQMVSASGTSYAFQLHFSFKANNLRQLPYGRRDSTHHE